MKAMKASTLQRWRLLKKWPTGSVCHQSGPPGPGRSLTQWQCPGWPGWPLRHVDPRRDVSRLAVREQLSRREHRHGPPAQARSPHGGIGVVAQVRTSRQQARRDGPARRWPGGARPPHRRTSASDRPPRGPGSAGAKRRRDHDHDPRSGPGWLRDGENRPMQVAAGPVQIDGGLQSSGPFAHSGLPQLRFQVTLLVRLPGWIGGPWSRKSKGA